MPSPCCIGFNVLIAEDNRINALLARKIVERAGGRATIVEDGRLGDCCRLGDDASIGNRPSISF